jgi:hypothetical protein
VIDAVSCTHGLLDDHIDRERQERFNKIQLFDAIAWVHQLLPSLHIKRKLASAAVHPTCSTIDLDLEEKLNEIAGAVADEVIVPIGTTCCGTAGDRGWLHPELVISATREVQAHLDAHPAEVYLSAHTDGRQTGGSTNTKKRNKAKTVSEVSSRRSSRPESHSIQLSVLLSEDPLLDVERAIQKLNTV